MKQLLLDYFFPGMGEGGGGFFLCTTIAWYTKWNQRLAEFSRFYLCPILSLAPSFDVRSICVKPRHIPGGEWERAVYLVGCVVRTLWACFWVYFGSCCQGSAKRHRRPSS